MRLWENKEKQLPHFSTAIFVGLEKMFAATTSDDLQSTYIPLPANVIEGLKTAYDETKALTTLFSERQKSGNPNLFGKEEIHLVDADGTPIDLADKRSMHVWQMQLFDFLMRNQLQTVANSAASEPPKKMACRKWISSSSNRNTRSVALRHRKRRPCWISLSLTLRHSS